jgi:hypothetical protein
LDEALGLCEQGQFTLSLERAIVFDELFDRLANRLCLVIRTIDNHSSRFGTLPNVAALAYSNFRGKTAQRISFMSSVLAKITFCGRARFFHKLHSLAEIIEELQKKTRAIVEDVSNGMQLFPDRAWQELEVLGYDLNTCMREMTVVLKSFLCVLPDEELEIFRQKLAAQVPALLTVNPRWMQPFQRK